MTEHDMVETTHPEAARKPRLVLMGEFSAGKSTLSNILLGSRPLPMRVTATRLPPVHIRFGAPGAWAIDLDGNKTPVALDNLEAVELNETQYIELHMQADALQKYDLVDMPGISDPNMPQRFWEDAVGPNDHVIWCTHATQAWRQSEAAIWNILRPQTSGVNLLLITQFDKLQNDRDKKRVVKRIKHETNGQFTAIYPVSLLSALNAGGDAQIWQESGAADFCGHVDALLRGEDYVPVPTPKLAEPQKAPMTDLNAQMPAQQSAPAQDSEPRIIPRRIGVRPSTVNRDRPTAEDIAAMRR